MKKAIIALLAIELMFGCVVQAQDFPQSWWPSFGYDNMKNAVCPWDYAPPIIEDKNWNVQLKTGVWSQPIASNDKLYILSVVDAAKNEKSSIHVLGLKDNFGKKLKNIDVSIVESANIQKYDDSPVATPAIAPLTTNVGGEENNDTLMVFGGNEGKLNFYVNETKTFEVALNGNNPIPITTSPTIHEGKIYVSSSNKRSYIVDIQDKTSSYFLTDKIVTSCITVWGNYAMVGDNSGAYYIFDKKDRSLIKKITLNGIDTIRSSACIASENGKTYAIFGSNKGGLHKVRLDNNSFDTQSLFVSRSQGRDEFWATPTYYDGYIYIGNENNFLYKIKLDSFEVANRINLNNSIFSQAVVNNGFLYINTANRVNNSDEFKGSLYIIKLDEFKVFGREFQIDGGAYSSPIFAAGRLFVASRTGKIYCFKGMQPSITVTPSDSVSFVSVPYDSKSVESKPLTITNSTNYTIISGTIRVDKNNEWLVVSQDKFEGNKITFNVSINLEKINDKTTTLTDTIYIDYVFGLDKYTKEIPVKITFEAKPPTFKVDRPLIKMEQVDANQMQSVKVSLEDKNTEQEFTYEAKHVEGDQWYNIDTPSFTLSKVKPWQIVTITVNVKDLENNYPGQTSFKAVMGISCIFRNKPTDTKLVSIELDLKKNFLKAVPVLKNNKIIKDLAFSQFINGFEEEVKLTISNKAKYGEMKISKAPSIDYGNSPSKDWVKLSSNLPISQDTQFQLDLTMKVSSKTFLPNKTYSAIITINFTEGQSVELTITYNTLTADKVTMKFVIGSTSYWVDLQGKTMSTPPFISSKGNTMVPIKPIADTLGYYYNAKINWYSDIKTVTLEMGDKTLRLVIGHNKAYIDNPDGSISEMYLSSPPEIKNGYTFIPPKVITDTFGGKSVWDSKTKTVTFEFINPRKAQ
jgi:hypothetical protein